MNKFSPFWRSLRALRAFLARFRWNSAILAQFDGDLRHFGAIPGGYPRHIIGILAQMVDLSKCLK
jgi:hypothetical protein